MFGIQDTYQRGKCVVPAVVIYIVVMMKNFTETYYPGPCSSLQFKQAKSTARMVTSVLQPPRQSAWCTGAGTSQQYCLLSKIVHNYREPSNVFVDALERRIIAVIVGVPLLRRPGGAHAEHLEAPSAADELAVGGTTPSRGPFGMNGCRNALPPSSWLPISANYTVVD